MTQKALPRHLYVLVMAAAGGSAFLGFLREAAVGALFGATATTDAYYAALTLPFLAAYFLVGGALTPPLTVWLASRLEKGDTAAAQALVGRAASVVVGWGLLGALALGVFASPVARLLVPGFAPEQVALTASLLRILLAFGVLTSLGLVLTAALTAAGSYRSPALAALCGNGVSVLLLVAFGRGQGIRVAAWSMVAGSLVFVLVQLARAAAVDVLPRSFDRGAPLPLRDTLLLTLSLGAAAAVDLAERSFASTAGVGAITILAFAAKLVHLPMRLFAAPLASIALPRLARYKGRAAMGLQDAHGPDRETRMVTGGVLSLLLFAASVTAVFAGPIVTITFRRGRFDAEAVTQLSRALLYLAPAVVAIGVLELFAKLLVAAGRTRAVAIAQACGLAAYLAVAPALAHRGVAGLALARDVSWGLAAALLFAALARAERSAPASSGAVAEPAEVVERV